MSHTEGKLSFDGHYILNDKGGAVGVFGGTDPENARRLAACWNALIAVSTDVIENDQDFHTVCEATMRVREAQKERDEALDVLRELAHGEYTDELGNRAIAILAKHKDKP